MTSALYNINDAAIPSPNVIVRFTIIFHRGWRSPVNHDFSPTFQLCGNKLVTAIFAKGEGGNADKAKASPVGKCMHDFVSDNVTGRVKAGKVRGIKGKGFKLGFHWLVGWFVRLKKMNLKPYTLQFAYTSTTLTKIIRLFSRPLYTVPIRPRINRPRSDQFRPGGKKSNPHFPAPIFPLSSLNKSVLIETQQGS